MLISLLLLVAISGYPDSSPMRDGAGNWIWLQEAEPIHDVMPEDDEPAPQIYVVPVAPTNIDDDDDVA